MGIRSERVEAAGAKGVYDLDACGRLASRDERAWDALRYISRSLVSARAVHHRASRWDAPFAGWGKCSERVNACNGEHLASVKRVLGKIAQAVTHSTLQYVSSVAFEQATPLYGKESPTLESPFLRANSTRPDDMKKQVVKLQSCRSSRGL